LAPSTFAGALCGQRPAVAINEGPAAAAAAEVRRNCRRVICCIAVTVAERLHRPGGRIDDLISRSVTPLETDGNPGRQDMNRDIVCAIAETLSLGPLGLIGRHVVRVPASPEGAIGVR
jgi:hypothetical protein